MQLKHSPDTQILWLKALCNPSFNIGEAKGKQSHLWITSCSSVKKQVFLSNFFPCSLCCPQQYWTVTKAKGTNSDTSGLSSCLFSRSLLLFCKFPLQRASHALLVYASWASVWLVNTHGELLRMESNSPGVISRVTGFHIHTFPQMFMVPIRNENCINFQDSNGAVDLYWAYTVQFFKVIVYATFLCIVSVAFSYLKHNILPVC